MADPIAIVGLIAGIVSLIDFGFKVVHRAESVRESRHGTIPEVHELDLIVDDVQSRSAGLQANSNAKRLSRSETRIVKMTAESLQVATELQHVLKTLKVRPGAWSKTIDSGRVIVRAMRKKGAIDELRRRLESLDRIITSSVQQTFQHHYGSAILSEVHALRNAQDGLQMGYSAKLDSIQDDILQLTQATNAATADAERLSRLKRCMEGFEEEHGVRRHALKVVESLYFPEIRRRWERIEKADEFTNAWLLDRSKTDFLDWLESGSGIYWITGKAGSGKSTMMKFASGHSKTQESLIKWAEPAEPYFPSFYFWNQGFEMQKSQTGLVQSLLYQILRRATDIIPRVCQERLHHERWGLEELKTTLQRVVGLESLPARFCFFIDGLDEYDGDEEELVKILSFFSDTLHIKLCVSSRPRYFLDEAFGHRRQTLVVHDFTKNDMESYVRRRLESNDKFRKLQSSGPACGQIQAQISERAKGVWLWVYLITHDLVHAVNRNEGVSTLQRILEQFPKDLESYFKHIIQGIKPAFREEMAQIFLITIEEVEPLPLFAFSLLEDEKNDADYAVTAPTSPLSSQRVEEADSSWKGRLQNRCGDLLVVEDGEHPTFLQHPVDFLHRTVRDFLRDCYYEKLQEELISDFTPLISLCHIMLFLLKGLPAVDFRQTLSMTRFIRIVDELLYYAHELERRDPSPDSPLVGVLNEVDRVGCHHARGSMRNHWTHVRDSPKARGRDEYREGGNCNFLALTVQARLVKYVGAVLDSDPRRMKKPGRPLLDYALRPRRVTPIAMSYHSRREDASIDIDMVRLLLDRGAGPNQKVHLNGGRSVWALFLLSCYESRDEASATLRDVWYRVSELMILHGAEAQCWLSDDAHLTVVQLLHGVFGPGKAANLQRLMDEALVQRPTSSWSLQSWFLSVF